MQELTTADRIELENVTKTNDDGAERETTNDVDRWQKYGKDRLYFNRADFHIDLQTEEIEFDGAAPRGELEVEGDMLIVTVEKKGWTTVYELRLHGDEFEPIEEDDEDEPEIVADGGEDVTNHVDDEEIEDAIDRHDDPDHPDALTVEEVRDLLAEIQLSFEEFWNEHMDTLEDGGLEVVEDTGDVVVFADHTGHGWNEELKAIDADGVSRSVIMSVHHAVADRLTDYSWSTSDPIVVRKPNGDGGQRYVEAVVNSLTNEGLSPGQAWAVYGVHVAGHSRNGWASMCGYSDHSAVSEPLRKANEKAPHIALLD